MEPARSAVWLCCCWGLRDPWTGGSSAWDWRASRRSASSDSSCCVCRTVCVAVMRRVCSAGPSTSSTRLATCCWKAAVCCSAVRASTSPAPSRASAIAASYAPFSSSSSIISSPRMSVSVCSASPCERTMLSGTSLRTQSPEFWAAAAEAAIACSKSEESPGCIGASWDADTDWKAVISSDCVRLVASSLKAEMMSPTKFRSSIWYEA
mmetsp:Transcript_1403/g.4184  ORF Transcript_1403/g.4184 Transcript_1403/m.4184 type:complete len:208 (-) Transcript_1403:612-1235(-)